jgi:hypothetical protein
VRLRLAPPFAAADAGDVARLFAVLATRARDADQFTPSAIRRLR